MDQEEKTTTIHESKSSLTLLHTDFKKAKPKSKDVHDHFVKKLQSL